MKIYYDKSQDLSYYLSFKTPIKTKRLDRKNTEKRVLPTYSNTVIKNLSGKR
jgi:hypothetical protein